MGPKTRRKLAPLQVHTVGDLAAVPEATLVATLGESAGHHLHALAWNRDDRPVVPEHEVKSIGHEETFPVDLHDRDALGHELVRLADKVGARLRAAHRAARTVQLKVRYGDFRTVTRSRTLAAPTDLGAELAAVARELLVALPVERGVRLIGVSGQQLVPTAEAADQATLFGDPGASDEPDDTAAPGDTTAPARPDRARQAAVERSMDAVREKFGPGAVGPGGGRSLGGARRPGR